MTRALTSAEVLVRCPLFAELPDAEIEAIAAVAVRRRFAAGEALFWAKDAPAGLHIVVSGCVKVFVLSPESGRELILTIERPYLTVAELPSFDGGPYPANAEAIQPTETLFVPQAALERLLDERPRLARHLLRALGRRLRRLVGIIEQLSFQEVAARLARYLLERGAPPFELESNASIAAQLGTVPELVSRNLARLHQSGVVRLAQRRVVALDASALAELAERARR